MFPTKYLKAVLLFVFFLLFFSSYSGLYAQCRILYEAKQEFTLSNVKWKFSSSSTLEEAIRISTNDVGWKDAYLSQDWEDLSDPERGIWYRCFVHLNTEAPQNMALHLSQNEVADKVFFNGTLIGETGDARKNQYDHTKERLYSIPQRLWQSGNNLISVHLSGTSVYTSGVQRLSIAEESFMVRKIFAKDIPKILLCLAYILLAILIALFHFSPRQNESLYLSLFAFSLGMHSLLQTWVRNEITSSFSLSYTIQRIFLFACAPLFFEYLQRICGQKRHKYSYIFYAISALLVLLLILLPSHPTVWSYLSKVSFLQIFFLAVYIVWLFWYSNIPAVQSKPYLKAGFVVLLICVPFDVLATMYLPSLPRLTSFGFLLFICGAFLETASSIITLFNNIIANEKQTRLVEKRKTHSIYSMSREFEKHLQKLSTTVESLSKTKAKQIAKRDKEAIQSSVIGLETLISDSEQLRKLESGTYIHKHSAIDIHEFCKKTIQKVLLATEQNKKRINLKIDRKISVFMSDVDLLLLASFHLLKNSLIYTEGKIEFNVQQTEKNEIRFEVIDEGPGIDTSEITQVFHKFSRAVESHSKINGLGIGLALVSLIAKSLNGRIEFNNNHGFFSVFVLRIPLN